MNFYDISFIKKIKENYGAEFARTAEIALITMFLYIACGFATGDFWNIKSLLISVFTPLLAGLNKYLRDEKKNLKFIYKICFGKRKS